MVVSIEKSSRRRGGSGFVTAPVLDPFGDLPRSSRTRTRWRCARHGQDCKKKLKFTRQVVAWVVEKKNLTLVRSGFCSKLATFGSSAYAGGRKLNWIAACCATRPFRGLIISSSACLFKRVNTVSKPAPPEPALRITCMKFRSSGKLSAHGKRKQVILLLVTLPAGIWMH